MSKGMFDVGDPSGNWQSPMDFTLRQTANTGVLDWNSKIWALFEADLPYELDEALRTKGTDNLGFLEGAPPSLPRPSFRPTAQCVAVCSVCLAVKVAPSCRLGHGGRPLPRGEGGGWQQAPGDDGQLSAGPRRHQHVCRV